MNMRTATYTREIAPALPSHSPDRRRDDRADRADRSHGDVQLPLEPIRFADRRRSTSADATVLPMRRSERMTRAVNVVLAVAAIIAILPLLALIAVAIAFTSRGPVIYTQVRVGLDRRSRRTRAMFDRRREDVGGRTFTIYKFRTMVVDAERDSGPVWARQRDCRITPLGQVLRKTRLDELPQLINVIKGDMNIVGPRPERPSLFVQLREEVDGYALRQRAKPGITGWAQVNQAYDSCIDDVRNKVRYDLEYIQRQSVIEDFRIMLKTVPVMLFRKGSV